MRVNNAEPILPDSSFLFILSAVALVVVVILIPSFHPACLKPASVWQIFLPLKIGGLFENIGTR